MPALLELPLAIASRQEPPKGASVRLRPVLWLVLLSTPLLAADAPTARGPEIVAGQSDADWQPLFAALANKGAVVSHFTEQRWFKLRKQPVEVTGEMRLAPEHGLSLHYDRDDRTVIVDEQGVLLRDARGHRREIRPNAHAPAVSTWLLPILRFDLSALAQAFRLYGAREDGAWRLDFVPRDDGDAAGADAGPITVTGSDEAIAHIELQPKPGLRIAIAIGETRTGVDFSPEELQRFFR